MERGPESLAEILSRLFLQRGWGRRQEQARIEEAWGRVAGPELAKKTRVSAFRRGVLEIEVNHATLLQELVGFHRRRLLRDLQTALTGVHLKDLRFRLAARPD
jgi:predicted nucleic acid-binding Zn ribbon protein